MVSEPVSCLLSRAVTAALPLAARFGPHQYRARPLAPSTKNGKNRSLLQRRRRIIRQLVLTRVRPLHFQLIKQQRRTDNRRRRATGPVAYQRIVAYGDQIAPQRANVELVEHRSTHQFFLPILCLTAIT